MAAPTPLGIHQIASGEQYALVADLNRVGVTTDAAIGFVKARAEYLTDKAVADAGGLSQRALNELPGLVVSEVDRVIGDTREDAAEALTVAQQAYEYNQTLIAPAAAVVNAIVTDPATPAGALVDSKVYVGDTYVGVTQQPGATMKDKLHAACAEASQTGATVMLPPVTIDVGTGFSMAGYSCGLTGHGTGGDIDVDGVAGDMGPTLYASQQSGPVLDFSGYRWNGFNGARRFDGFRLRGNNVPDPTRKNVGMWLEDTKSYGHTPSPSQFSNIVITDTGGPALAGRVVYFMRFDNLALFNPREAHVNDIPCVEFENLSSCRMSAVIYGKPYYHLAPSGAVRIVAGENPDSPEVPYDSRWNDIDISTQKYKIGIKGTILHYEGNASRLRVERWDSLQPVMGDTSAIRLGNPTRGSNYGGNIVHGLIGGGGPASPAFDWGVDVYQSGNVIEGPASHGQNVRLRPGVTGTYVNLQSLTSGSRRTTSGVLDESGQRGKNTIRDHTVYPYDGHNPAPVTLASDVTTSSRYRVEEAMRVDLPAPGTYRLTLDCWYTVDADTDIRVALLNSNNTTVTSYANAPALAAATADAPDKESSGTGAHALGGTGTLQQATITAIMTCPGDGISDVKPTWGPIQANGKSVTIHAGARLSAERIS